jgi:acetyl esterase/lipase
VLCGESARRRLVFSLAMRLRELALPRPGGIIAISPWTDLTFSGQSYRTKNEIDPVLCTERLGYYATLYSNNPRDPLVSPLLGDVEDFPPCLIFVGEDEILLDDSVGFYEN